MFGLILAATLASTPVAPATAVNVDVREANRWIGVDVKVQAWSRNDVDVEQQENDGDVQARVSRDGATVRVVAVYTGPKTTSFFGLIHHGANHGVHWIVHVPKNSALDVQASNGGVGVAGVTAPVAVATSNGGISITGAGPRVRAHSSNGGIHVQIATLAGGSPQVDIQTSNGGIGLQVPAGFSTRINAHTSNGGVHNPFANATGPGSATLRTANGGISVTSGG